MAMSTQAVGFLSLWVVSVLGVSRYHGSFAFSVWMAKRNRSVAWHFPGDNERAPAGEAKESDPGVCGCFGGARGGRVDASVR